MAKPKRFIIYTRCSTDDQAKGDYTTLDAQEMHCKAYLDACGYEHVRTVHDRGYSGKDLNRPGVQAVIRDLARTDRDFDGVIFHKLDRLSRRPVDVYQLVDMFKAAGVAFISREEKLDTDSPAGRAMMGLIGIFAAFEREQLGERVKASVEARRREGRWTGGTVPTAYRIIRGKDGQGGPELDPEVAPHLADIWELAAAGKSLADIAQILARRGVRNKKGAYLRPQTVAGIIRNPFYKGYVRTSGGGLHKPRHQRLVEPAAWQRANKAVQGRQVRHKFTKSGKSYAYLLEGLLKCAECGSRFVTTVSLGRGRKPFYYYICSLKNVKGCRAARIPARALDEQVARYLAANAAEVAETIENALVKAREQATRQTGPLVELKRRHDKVRTEGAELLERALAMGLKDNLALKDKLDVLDADRRGLEEEIVRLEARKRAAEMAETNADFMRQNVVGLLSRFGEARAESQKSLLAALVKDIAVSEDQLELTLYAPARGAQKDALARHLSELCAPCGLPEGG